MNYNLSFDFAGVFFLMLLLFILQKFYVINSKSSKYFREFLVISLAAGIFDIITALTIDYASHVPSVLNTILNTIYLFLASYATFSGARYIFSTVKFETKMPGTVNNLIVILYSILLFINLFTGVVFDFKGRTYNHGPLYTASFVESFLIMFFSAGVLVYNHDRFTKKQLFLFSSFVICPLIFVLFQLFFPQNLMTVFATASSALLIMFAIETPDFVELEYLRKNLEKEVQSRTHDLKKANKELEKKNRQALQDMELAAQVQRVLYPHSTSYLGWDIAVEFRPLSGISGDLYDFYCLEGKLRGIGLFDVSGHGISSGLVTVLAKNTIFHEFRTTLPLSLSDAMIRINNSVIRVKGGIQNYLTGIVLRIDKEDDSKLELANAGSPYPIYKAKNKKKSILIKPDSKKPQYGMLGLEGIDVFFQTIKRKMNIGDTLVLYTDGLTESENKKGEQYGIERLQNAVDSATGTAQEILDYINDDFKTFIGKAELEDDISIIVIKRDKEDSKTGSKQDNSDLIEELEAVE